MSDIAPHTADLSSAMPTAAAAGTASEAPQPGNESATDTPSSAPADSTGRATRPRTGVREPSTVKMFSGPIAGRKV